MFDAYHHAGYKSVNVRADVTERRAPTDESVRLLREMRAAAEAEIVRAIRVEDTAFTGVIHTMRDPLSAMVKIKVVYSLNGKKMTTDYAFSETLSPEKWVRGLVDAVANDIALQILNKSISAAMREVGRTGD